eukprot:scaffold40312_cov100-Phaeocystis_antarctica.AAC.1
MNTLARAQVLTALVSAAHPIAPDHSVRMSGTSVVYPKKTSTLDQDQTSPPGAASEEATEKEDDRHDRLLRIRDALSERDAIRVSYIVAPRAPPILPLNLTVRWIELPD